MVGIGMRQVNSHCEEPAHVRSGRVTLTARRELPFFPDQRTSPIRCASGPKSADFVAKVG
jgi:hypothetical protein